MESTDGVHSMSGQVKDPEAYFDANCERRITLKHLAGRENPGSGAQFISLDSVWKLVIDPNNWVGEGAEDLQKFKQFQVRNSLSAFRIALFNAFQAGRHSRRRKRSLQVHR